MLTLCELIITMRKVIVTSHQPGYLPWCGFFQKALKADLFVLLDNVQFPRGQSWVNRNRIKGPSGTIWLTVPVKKKGKGLQSIRDVEAYNERDWQRKHCLTLLHAYGNAPYFEEHFPFFREIYSREWERLIDLNLTTLNYIKETLSLKTEFKLASTLGVEGRGTELLQKICEKSGSNTYLVSHAARRYIDPSEFEAKVIKLLFPNFKQPVYPQLWGEFIPNLSIVDLIFNCGDKSSRILEKFSE